MSSKLENDYTYPVDDDDNTTTTEATATKTKQEAAATAEPKSEWEKYLDSLDEARLKELAELAKKKTYVIEGQEYTRKKIKVKQFNDLERLRARFSREKDPVKATEYLINVYAKCAEYFLGIDQDIFENMDWEITKPIIDACNFRSLRGGLPN